jgi:RNA polymerase sigma-70 factor (ECF subfamily)
MSVFENDRPLLDAFRAGERGALERVYRRYVDEVQAILRHGFAVEWKGQLRVRGADVDVVEDLAQEVFVRAFAEPARLAYDGLRPYGPYLRAIARNLLADSLRRRRPDIVLTDEMVEAAGAPPDEDEHFDEELAATQQFLTTLPAELRTFVQLRFTEGLSQLEVAARIGATRRHVRTIEARVLKALRKHLRSRGMRST